MPIGNTSSSWKNSSSSTEAGAPAAGQGPAGAGRQCASSWSRQQQRADKMDGLIKQQNADNERLKQSGIAMEKSVMELRNENSRLTSQMAEQKKKSQALEKAGYDANSLLEEAKKRAAQLHGPSSKRTPTRLLEKAKQQAQTGLGRRQGKGRPAGGTGASGGCQAAARGGAEGSPGEPAAVGAAGAAGHRSDHSGRPAGGSADFKRGPVPFRPGQPPVRRLLPRNGAVHYQGHGSAGGAWNSGCAPWTKPWPRPIPSRKSKADSNRRGRTASTASSPTCFK